MTAKYLDRNNEMKRLRYEEGKTLQEIATIYNVSRERVRQLVGSVGRNFRTAWTENLSKNYDLSKTESVKDLPGSTSVWRKLWGKFRHKAKNGWIKKGQEYEELALAILLEHGIESELMPTRHSFDLLVRGRIRVDVKHSNFDAQSMKSQACVSPTFPISNMKCGKDCDFFIVFIPHGDNHAIFVIPASEVTTERIRVVYPQMGFKSSKWTQWKDRFDLLK